MLSGQMASLKLCPCRMKFPKSISSSHSSFGLKKSFRIRNRSLFPNSVIAEESLARFVAISVPILVKAALASSTVFLLTEMVIYFSCTMFWVAAAFLSNILLYSARYSSIPSFFACNISVRRNSFRFSFRLLIVILMDASTGREFKKEQN